MSLLMEGRKNLRRGDHYVRARGAGGGKRGGGKGASLEGK